MTNFLFTMFFAGVVAASAGYIMTIESNNPTNQGDRRSITGTDLPGRKRAMDVALYGSQSAFGDLQTVSLLPLVQIDAVYGLRASDVETFTATGGSVSVKRDHGRNEFQASTGTSVGGYGLIRSKRAGRYRPGQGLNARFTARFTEPVANSLQRAGLITSGNELSVGYGDEVNFTTDFGIFYRTGGRLAIRRLDITTPASGAETATVTLNGVAYTVNLTAGTAAHNAFQIAADADFAAAGINAFQNDGAVTFVFSTLGPKAGAYSFSSTGAAAGSYTVVETGRAAEDIFISQSSWNISTLSDSNDPFILDPENINVYQIKLQYLGGGSITFSAEDPATGYFADIHRIHYANNYTKPSLDNPSMKIGWFAASFGSTTDLSAYGASAAIFNEGARVAVRPPTAHGNTKTGVGTTFTNIISIRVRPDFNGRVNLTEVLPIEAFVAVDGTKPAEFEIFLYNATEAAGIIGGEPNWTYHDETNSVVEYDTAGTTVSGEKHIAGGAIAKSGNVSIDLRKYSAELGRGDILTIAVRATSATTDATAYISWLED